MRLITIVFDLDDTLYPEIAFVRSGVRAVIAVISDRFGISVPIDEVPIHQSPLSWIMDRVDLPEVDMEFLLDTYRYHRPSIELFPQAQPLIQHCRSMDAAIGVLTDGRSITQRAKIEALGLAPDAIVISEEIGAVKPSCIGFQRIERQCPARHFVYIGDNPMKDFKAPNSLGWTTIGLKAVDGCIHRWSETDIQEGWGPAHWVEDLGCVSAILSGGK